MEKKKNTERNNKGGRPPKSTADKLKYRVTVKLATPDYYTKDDLKAAFDEAQTQTTEIRKTLRSTGKNFVRSTNKFIIQGNIWLTNQCTGNFLTARIRRSSSWNTRRRSLYMKLPGKYWKNIQKMENCLPWNCWKQKKKSSQYEAYRNLWEYEKELHIVQTNIDTFLGKNRSRQTAQERESTRSWISALCQKAHGDFSLLRVPILCILFQLFDFLYI